MERPPLLQARRPAAVMSDSDSIIVLLARIEQSVEALSTLTERLVIKVGKWPPPGTYGPQKRLLAANPAQREA